MLGYLILAALQFAIAFFGTPIVAGLLPIPGGDAQNYVYAAIAATIVWFVGVLGSLFLRDVKMPAASTLVAALLGALIGAAIVTTVVAKQHIPFSAPPPFFWISGAILGFMARR